jgi:hypothetical protein
MELQTDQFECCLAETGCSQAEQFLERVAGTNTAQEVRTAGDAGVAGVAGADVAGAAAASSLALPRLLAQVADRHIFLCSGWEQISNALQNFESFAEIGFLSERIPVRPKITTRYFGERMRSPPT